MSTIKARRWMWVDIEAPGLPEGSDFSKIPPMEIAVIVTDFNLNRLGGYVEAVKMNNDIANALRSNQFAREMHTKNGLIKDCIKNAPLTLGQIEDGIIDLLQEQGEPGEFQIAGSGVAMYDFPLIKYWMPTLHTWLDYAPFDIGIMRRGISRLVGKEIVTHTPASYGAEKLHRAMQDVEGHLEETQKYQEVLRAAFLTEPQVDDRIQDVEGLLP